LLIEVSQQSLSVALQHITPVVSTKSVIPFLSGIRLNVDDNGLTLTTANSGVMVQYRIPNDTQDLVIRKNGSVVIPSRYFTDIIRNMPAGIVTINGVQNVCIQSGKAIYNLNGMNPNEFPHFIKQETYSRLSLPNHDLKQMIKKVIFALSSSEARPVLTGVCCEVNDEHLRIVATDGIRLAAQTTNDYLIEDFQKNINVIIPGKHLSDYSKMLTDQQSTTFITIGSNIITFNTKNITFQSSLIEGTYPSIDRITPDTFTSEFIADTDILLSALERVTLLSGEGKVVKLIIKTINSIDLSSQTAEIGDVNEEIQVDELFGSQVNISFNGKYMIDILRCIDSEKVKVSFSDKWKPIVVQPSDNSGSLFLITPIRTPDY
jgi:DNA polymerase-3 subunit beta